MPNPDLVARIAAGGDIYENWTSVSVTRTYTGWTSDFAFTCAEPSTADTIKLKPNDRATIFLGGELVINGFIEVRSAGYDANQHQVIVQGRSKVGDLIDSSAEPAEFKGYDLAAIARGMIKPHDIKLVIDNLPPVASKPIRVFRVHYGETVFEALERLARMRGVFFSDDENGNLVMSSVKQLGAPVADFVEGQNILRASAMLRTEAASFSKYQVSGQDIGSDDRRGATVAQVSAVATDPGIRANRKLVMLAEEPLDQQDAQARADREVAESIARQVEVIIVVPGWKRPDGKLWRPTDHCTVQSPRLFPSQNGKVSLAIREVTFSQTAPGETTTTLNLCLPNALSILPRVKDLEPGTPGILTSSAGPAQPQVGSA